LGLPGNFLDEVLPPAPARSAEATWFAHGAGLRVAEIKRTVRSYTPWLLPEFASLRQDAVLQLPVQKSFPLESLPSVLDFLLARLSCVLASTQLPPERAVLCLQLQELMREARRRVTDLISGIRGLAEQARALADQMDFQFLMNPRRKLLSVGFDVAVGKLHPSCYDLLATEARMATFVAVAKEELPQEAWFLLGRAHTLSHGRPVLLSWTGTMFEYLMPSLWMRSYPNTLLDRSRVTAVAVQQAYAAMHQVPWGISESAFFDFDGEGNYQYAAFGVPGLGLKKQYSEALVISPYSTLLALDVDTFEAVRNLRSMARLGWLGAYGFYEAADFTASLHHSHRSCHIVTCWMAHHQGMSLLALGNLLRERVVQRWFHSNPYVQATELLLQEKPVTHIKAAKLRSAAA
jgi:cyclic beta-1,2-glucan synthetase